MHGSCLDLAAISNYTPSERLCFRTSLAIAIPYLVCNT